MTQHDRIVRYCELNGTITPMEAFTELGITKLSTRIGELERRGVKFNREREKSKNRYGEECVYMRYWLDREEVCLNG